MLEDGLPEVAPGGALTAPLTDPRGEAMFGVEGRHKVLR